MDRLEKIKKFAELKEEEEKLQKQKEENEIEELKNKALKYSKRVKYICSLISELYANKILEASKRTGDKKFFADGYYHKLGVSYVDYPYRYGKTLFKFNYNQTVDGHFASTLSVCIIGGGCSDYNLIFLPTGDILVEGDKKYVLNRFLNEFEAFEKEVFDFVDNL